MRGQSGEDEGRLGRRVAQIIQDQDPAMWARVAMHQCADVTVFRQKDSPICESLGQSGFIAGISSPFAYVDDIMARISHGPNRACHDIRIRKQAHAIRRRT